MYQLQVLIVDDEEDTVQALKMGLEDTGYLIKTTTKFNDAINIIRSEEIDVVVTDLKLKDGNGLEILNYIQENSLSISVIIITAYGSVESAVEAIRGGAYDYLVKPFRISELKKLLSRLNEMILLRRENELLKERLKAVPEIPKLIGVNPKFKQLLDLVKQIAPSKSTVLIIGETGTGKEMIAQAIHGYSNRASKPLVIINCGAIPETLLEAELFGYERGAFTGAVKQKKGKIEVADGGSIFLDEVSELTLGMQVKLLRVLQSGEFERIGSNTTLKADIRFIAATNTNLEEYVNAGKFREDLFYRLNVISVKMPPLRERLEDIPYLVQHFIDKFNKVNNKNIQGVDPDVLKLMMQYNWHGNIRELENMIERAVVLCQENMLKLYHFPILAAGMKDAQKTLPVEVGMPLAEIEKTAISKTLQFYNFDKQKSARSLQIGLATLYRKIKDINWSNKP
jgi:DNA-binding NtrC family response regulator